MPALPPVSQVLKLTLHWDDGSDMAAATILHWQYLGGAPTSAQINTFCTNFNALTAAEWPIVLDADSKYLGIDVIDLSSSTSGAGSAATSVNGARGTAILGAGSAVLAHYSIGRRYRGGKPRSYLPWGVSDDLSSRQTWGGAAVTSFTTTWAAILNAVPAAGPIGAAALVSQCVVSYYGPPNRTITGSTGRVRTVSTTRAVPIVDLISGFTISPKVASQRRRNLQRT